MEQLKIGMRVRLRPDFASIRTCQTATVEKLVNDLDDPACLLIFDFPDGGFHLKGLYYTSNVEPRIRAIVVGNELRWEEV